MEGHKRESYNRVLMGTSGPKRRKWWEARELTITNKLHQILLG
jgi:hypothetical protein